MSRDIIGREGFWTKSGVVVGAIGVLFSAIIGYFTIAIAINWPPFAKPYAAAPRGDLIHPAQSARKPPHLKPPAHSTTPSHSTPSLYAKRPPNSPPPYSRPPYSPPPSPPVLTPGATFASVEPLGEGRCNCEYQYRVQINLVGLEGDSCTLEWWTVYNYSGADAGTRGNISTGALLYDRDTWTDTFTVTVPAAANAYGWAWHTAFAVYSPDGTQLAADP